MNLSDLLNLIYIYDQRLAKELKRTSKHWSPLQKLEDNYVIARLRDFVNTQGIEDRVANEPNAVLTDEEEQMLVTFLGQRWNRIQNTNSAYTIDFKNPSNIICLNIARDLGKNLHRKWIELLMPTVRGVANPYTVADYDDETKLAHFVMSDDNTQLIHIDSALKEYEQKGRMTKVVNGMQVELSDAERMCIINHTQNTTRFHGMITEIRGLRSISGTLGYELHKLKVSLEHSSTDGDGSEYIAGNDINLSILGLVKIIESLESTSDGKKILETLFSSTSKDGTNFKFIWDVLTDNRMRATNAARCAKTLSAQVEAVLDNNPNLFNIKMDSEHHVYVNVDKQSKKREQIRSDYELEHLNGADFVNYEFSQQDELVFILSILTDAVGIKLFCANPKNINHVFAMKPEEQIQAVKTLLASAPGKQYIDHLLASPTEKNHDILKGIVEKIQLEEQEAQKAKTLAVSSSTKKRRRKKTLEVEEGEISFLSYADVTLIEESYGTDQQRLELAIRNSMMESDLREKRHIKKSNSSQASEPVAEEVIPDLILLDNDSEQVAEKGVKAAEPIATLILSDDEPEQLYEDAMDIDTVYPVVKSQKVKTPDIEPVSGSAVFKSLFVSSLGRDTQEKNHNPVALSEAERSDEHKVQPVKKKRSLDDVEGNIAEPEPAKRPKDNSSRHNEFNSQSGTVSQSGFFSIPIQTPITHPETSSSTEDYRKKPWSRPRNSYNVTEYCTALSSLNTALAERKITACFEFYSQASDFLDTNKAQLNSNWYNTQERIIKSKLHVIVSAKKYHQERENGYLTVNKELIRKAANAIHDQHFYEAMYYLEKQLILLSESEIQYSYEWFQRHKNEIRDRLMECMNFIVRADLNVLADQYMGRPLADLHSWNQSFVSMAHYYQLNLSASDLFQNASEASKQLLEKITAKENTDAWLLSSFSL
jgi:hypothetical protein